jgi:hypothetical protein
MDDKWRVIRCYCSGGIVWSYSKEGPDECDSCNGSGDIYIRPKGHMFQFPGGPALGLGGEERYKKGTPVMPFEWHCWNETEEEINSFKLDRHGSLDLSNYVHCRCGWEGTLKDHEKHIIIEEEKFISEHTPVA